MLLAEFINDFIDYYGIDCENKTNKIRIKYLKEWLEDKAYLDSIFKQTVDNFVPTSINPYPLIPHIKELNAETGNLITKKLKAFMDGER